VKAITGSSISLTSTGVSDIDEVLVTASAIVCSITIVSATTSASGSKVTTCSCISGS